MPSLPSALPIRRCAKRRGTSSIHRLTARISKRRRIPLIQAIVTASLHAIRTPRGAKTIAVSVAIVAGEFLDDEGEFLLEDFDALEDDGVGFEVTDGFDVEVEFARVGGEVEGFSVLGGVFPGGVVGLWPAYLLVWIKSPYRCAKA